MKHSTVQYTGRSLRVFISLLLARSDGWVGGSIDLLVFLVIGSLCFRFPVATTSIVKFAVQCTVGRLE